MADGTKNLTMGDLMLRFRCEDACRDYLEALRWPEGVRCPRCDCGKVGRIPTRNQYECAECRYHFSVTAGTKIHDSHLPLWKWFLVTFLMIHAKKGISAKQLQRMVGGSYKTAWHLCHRIRDAMRVVNDNQDKLSGIVEIDETWIGGKNIGMGKSNRTLGKEIVIGAVERGGRVRLGVIPNFGKKTMHNWIRRVTADETRAYFTDEHASYKGIADHNTEHWTVTHSKKIWAVGQVHTQTIEGVFSLLKRSILGSYHKLSAKHLPAYLEETAFKYNNRSNPYLFRETLIALLESEPLEMKQLTA